MFCKKCGKEIADDSEFCQFCGIKQKEELNTSKHDDCKQENKNENEYNSTNENYKFASAIVAIGIILFILLIGNVSKNNSSQTSNTPSATSSNNCPSYEELIDADNLYIKGGIVSKSVPSLNSVYVTRKAQNQLNYDDYQTMGYLYACLSEKVKKSGTYWSEIYDDVTHKRIAKYSDTWGLKID